MLSCTPAVACWKRPFVPCRQRQDSASLVRRYINLAAHYHGFAAGVPSTFQHALANRIGMGVHASSTGCERTAQLRAV